LKILFRYTDSLELDDAIHCALLTLKESFDVGMTEENVELAICNASGFQRLSKQQVKDHLQSM
jgi:20S proteasome subunit alpha 2